MLLKQKEVLTCFTLYQAVALAASVVSGTSLHLLSQVATAEEEEKENKELSSRRTLSSVASTTRDGQHTADSPIMFRWPLLFQMVSSTSIVWYIHLVSVIREV